MFFTVWYQVDNGYYQRSGLWVENCYVISYNIITDVFLTVNIDVY